MNRRSEIADLDSPDVRTFDQRHNVELMRQGLRPNESVIVVARASGGQRLRSGILGLTNERLLYVMERFLRRPIQISIPLADLLDVKLAEQPLSGVLHVITADSTSTFAYIRPKARTWPFYWALKKELESRTP